MNSFFQTNIEKISLQKQLGISFSLLLPLVLLAFSNPIQSSQKKSPSIFCHSVYFLTLQIMLFRNFSEYLWLRYPCVHRSLLLGPLFMRESLERKKFRSLEKKYLWQTWIQHNISLCTPTIFVRKTFVHTTIFVRKTVPEWVEQFKGCESWGVVLCFFCKNRFVFTTKAPGFHYKVGCAKDALQILCCWPWNHSKSAWKSSTKLHFVFFEGLDRWIGRWVL